MFLSNKIIFLWFLIQLLSKRNLKRSFFFYIANPMSNRNAMKTQKMQPSSSIFIVRYHISMSIENLLSLLPYGEWDINLCSCLCRCR